MYELVKLRYNGQIKKFFPADFRAKERLLAVYAVASCDHLLPVLPTPRATNFHFAKLKTSSTWKFVVPELVIRATNDQQMLPVLLDLNKLFACVTNFFVFLLNVLIIQWSISWNPVN